MGLSTMFGLCNILTALSAKLLLFILLWPTLIAPNVYALSPSVGNRTLSSTTIIVPRAFNIKLICTSHTALCIKTENAMLNAARRIELEFRFRQTIYIEAVISTPNQPITDMNCQNDKAGGFAWPIQNFLLRHKNEKITYSYPVALFKQATLNIDPNLLPKFDIKACLNADKDWWFAADKVPIRPNQIDMEMLILHEFLHGLGFGINNAMRYTLKSERGLLPIFDQYASLTPMPNKQTVDNDLFFRFSPPTVWDKYMDYVLPRNYALLSNNQIAHKGRVVTLYMQINDTLNRLINDKKLTPVGVNRTAKWFNWKDVQQKLLGSKSIHSLSNTLYALATTPGTIYFATSSGGKIVLETSLRPYAIYGSLSHVQDSRFDKNFLMAYKPQVGYSLAEMIAISGAPDSGIGAAIVDIMATLGYQRKTEGVISSFGVNMEIVDSAAPLLSSNYT